MAEIPNMRWQRLAGQLGEIAYELTQVRFSTLAYIHVWRPTINAFRCQKGILICVDLAGVDKSQVDLQLEPRRLFIRGHRPCPEPDLAQREAVQVLAMEIDCGAFEREVVLPEEVDPDRATAEQ